MLVLMVAACLACSGYLAYEKIVKQLLDGDYYAMYSPAGVDNTQVTGPLNAAVAYATDCGAMQASRSIL